MAAARARRTPACAVCGEEIIVCASCCRHTGWRHKKTGLHHSDDPKHHYARPLRYGRTDYLHRFADAADALRSCADI